MHFLFLHILVFFFFYISYIFCLHLPIDVELQHLRFAALQVLESPCAVRPESHPRRPSWACNSQGFFLLTLPVKVIAGGGGGGGELSRIFSIIYVASVLQRSWACAECSSKYETLRTALRKRLFVLRPEVVGLSSVQGQVDLSTLQHRIEGGGRGALFAALSGCTTFLN